MYIIARMTFFRSTKSKGIYPVFSVLVLIMFLMIFNMFRLSTFARVELASDLIALDLPVLIVNVDDNKPIKSRTDYEKADFVLYKNYANKEVLFEGRAKIRGRGNSTWKTIDTSKRSYLFKTDSAIEPFDFPQARKWILMSNVTDKTSLRNVYAYHIADEIFQGAGWAPHTQFITLVINQKVEGLYGFMEKAEIAQGRVDLPLDDSSFLAEVNSRLNREWNFKSDEGISLSIRERAGADSEYYRGAEDFLTRFEKILYSDEFADSESGWRSLADEKSFIDWYLINEYTKNHDAWFQDSCFMRYDTRARKLYMGPAWDFDLSCGNYRKRDCDKPEGLHVQLKGWFSRLWEDDAFKKAVASRWEETLPKVKESIDWLAAQADFLKDAANTDDTIWRRFGKRQWPHAPGWRDRKTYQAEVDYLTSWLQTRIDWLTQEFSTY